jgi:hypothetical protein
MRIVEALRKQGYIVGGMVSREVREACARMGFDIELLATGRCILVLLFVAVSPQSQIHIRFLRLRDICVLKPSNVASKFGGSGVNQDAEKCPLIPQ